MSNRYSKIVILCEDTQQESFIHRFLKKAHGIQSSLLRVMKNPAGKGSGEQFVRNKFPDELKAIRQRHARTVLIAAIDADNKGIIETVRTLDISCTDAGIEPHTSRDNVAFVIPKRNIETWITWLNGETVDEETAYPKLSSAPECQPAIERLEELCKESNTHPDFPESLATACIEYRKVKNGFSV